MIAVFERVEPEAAQPSEHHSRSRPHPNIRIIISKIDGAWAYLFHQGLQGAFGVREMDRVPRLFK
jgi:hypothetical protein